MELRHFSQHLAMLNAFFKPWYFRKNIPGEPGKDYPIFSTNILCKINPANPGCGGAGGGNNGRKRKGGNQGQGNNGK